MYSGLLHLHNFLRWVIIVLLLIALIQALSSKQGIRKTSLWLLISAHITLLLGIYQWIVGEVGLKMIQQTGMAEVMHNPASRFWAVEHPTGMLIAIILITVARGKAKVLNYKVVSWLYLLAFIVILISVPWPFREGIGRPWFPGMQ
jgi:disulfide bond formation protein DsbB